MDGRNTRGTKVELTIGQSYLLFSGGMADQDKLPGYWRLLGPEQAWTADQKGFHLYPGFPWSRPRRISRNLINALHSVS